MCRSGRDGVDANPERPELCSQDSRSLVDRGLARRVDQRARHRDVGGRRAQVDNLPLALAQRSHGLAAKTEHTDEIDAELPLDNLVRRLDEWGHRPGRGVIDEQVEAPEALEHCGNDPWGIPGLADVGGQIRDLTVVTRGDLLFVQTVRAFVRACGSGEAGWLMAMLDSKIGRALGCLHDRPEHPWSVATLARAVGLSRSILAGHFKQLVGESPMQYLKRWRMQLAAQQLRLDDTSTVAEIARRVGHESEAAFGVAFKQQFHAAPGIWRRTQRP